jgi:hypothetical protein
MHSHKEYRLNQKDVRVIPIVVPYDEIDPLPPKKKVGEDEPTEPVSPLVFKEEPSIFQN